MRNKAVLIFRTNAKQIKKKQKTKFQIPDSKKYGAYLKKSFKNFA